MRGSKYIDKLAGVLYDMLPGSGNARLSRWDEADEERGQRWQRRQNPLRRRCETHYAILVEMAKVAGSKAGRLEIGPGVG